MKVLKVKNKLYSLPMFLPDATFGVVRALDSVDLNLTNTLGVVVNTLHLNSLWKSEFENIKKFMNFNGLVVSDSGGWQVFSLIHRNNSGLGKISDYGVEFFLNKEKDTFTPEDSIDMQFKIGSDVIICLDDFTPPNSNYSENLESVNRTTAWAKRCKDRYLENSKNLDSQNKPLIFAVVQGNTDLKLREKSYKDLEQIGFDGFGFGGYVVDSSGLLNYEVSEYLGNLISDKYFKFALGIGKPRDISKLKNFGWEFFDCTLPTRDARHGRLYKFSNLNKSYETISIRKTIYSTQNIKIDESCECHTCQNFTLSYLHHLYKNKSHTYFRLASIHNLFFYNLFTKIS